MGKLSAGLILLSLIWGTSFLFIKILLATLGPEAVVLGRTFFGFIMLFIIYLFYKKKPQLKQLPWSKLTLVALTNNVIPWLLICSSETKLSSSVASIINATTPIWTLVIGFFFFSSSLRKAQWLGIIVGFLGIFILSDFKIGDFHNGNTIGILMMSGATLSYGLGAQFSKKFLSQLSVMEISFFTLMISAILSFFIMLFLTPQSFQAFFNAGILIPLFGLGALGSGVAYLLYYFLVQKGSPEFASLVTYLVPVSAILWGAVLLKEKIHLSVVVGLLVIFLGVYISSLKSKNKAKENAAA